MHVGDNPWPLPICHQFGEHHFLPGHVGCPTKITSGQGVVKDSNVISPLLSLGCLVQMLLSDVIGALEVAPQVLGIPDHWLGV